MLVLGHWVTTRILDGVVQSHAAAAKLYADNFIKPHVQALASASKLTAESERALDALLLPQSVGQPIVGFRVWKGDTVVYSDRRELVGQAFAPSVRRKRAWAGQVSAKYGALEPGHGPREERGEPILEIYVPVQLSGGSEVIALAETYHLAPSLPDELAQARIGTWLVLGATTLCMLLLQFAVVRKGSRTIEGQRAALDERINQLSRLLQENESLRHRANHANRRVMEVTEQYQRRIGSDLHDGPVQILSSAVLRADALSQALAGCDQAIAEEASEDIALLREALHETLGELRNISAGLAPPDTEHLSLSATLELAVRRHERRTGNSVACNIQPLPDDVPAALKSCLYRFTQEGLSNSLRHAGGRGQAVSAQCAGGHIEVHILDDGPGFDATEASTCHGGQGLGGLRDRIESLGGEFRIGMQPRGGTRLTARFELIPSAVGMTS
jgi:signal transduction histidine kinase